MNDPRINKLAKVLVSYSLGIIPGYKMIISAPPLASDLTLAVYEEAIKAGAHVHIFQPVPEAREIFYKFASDAQLDFVSPIQRMIVETYDAALFIDAPENRRSLSGIDPGRMVRNNKAYTEISKILSQRTARGEYHWCYTVLPNNANAQDAGMSLRDYSEFVFGAGMLNEEDPVKFWKELGVRHDNLLEWLNGHDQMVFKGADIDLTLSIKDRKFISADGKLNFPDGEIYTTPVENSVNGWVRFHYPAIFMGQEITNVQLWFEDGKVVKEKADENQPLLTSNLNTDEGARRLGELGIGTNYGITRFTKDMLFDEKIGGTIHFAVGEGFPEAGGKNESAVHWDLLVDMADSEVSLDNELFYKNGKPVVG